MIIREHDQAFIMTEQNHHAHISAEIILNWKDIFLKDDSYADSVLYAIRNHDYAWRLFDQQPFWNDETETPYAFTDFPVLAKIALYTQGVDEVEKENAYAAALCSAHYIKFLKNDAYLEVQDYLGQEKERIQRILANSHVTDELFNQHLAILQFADNISLYICLNDPGTSKSREHFFFKAGIPISKKINQISTDIIQTKWLDDKTISLKGLPYVPSFSVLVKQKVLNKQTIQQKGLVKHYQAVPYEEIKIIFKSS